MNEYIKKINDDFYVLSHDKKINSWSYGVSRTDPYSAYSFVEIEQYYNEHPEMRFEYYDGELERNTYYNTLHTLQAELTELNDWFSNVYDIQVQQYNRSARLNLPYDAKYGTIEELDALATKNSIRIRELRIEIAELEKTKPNE